MRPDPICERCEEVEKMEHLCECLHYSQLIWIWLGESSPAISELSSQDLLQWVKLGQLTITYNFPHLLLLLYNQDKLTQNAFLKKSQEIKRDIIYCGMNFHPSAKQVTNLQWLTAHLDLTLHRLCSYFQYIGLSKYATAILALQTLQGEKIFLS